MRLLTIPQTNRDCQALRKNLTPRVFLVLFLAVFALIIAPSAKANHISWEAKAEKVLQSDYRLTMRPGEIKTIAVAFKNISTNMRWRSHSKNYASLYTVGPRYRQSVFYHPSWLGKNHLAKMKNAEAGKDALAQFEFKIQAPKKLGAYTEDFSLALENLAWVKGGLFQLQIDVVESMDSTSEDQPELKTSDKYKAKLLLLSHKEVQMKANETVRVRFGFKNDGKGDWKNLGLRPVSTVRIASSDPVPIEDWFDSPTPTFIDNANVLPGRLVFLDLDLKAPARGGKYNLKMALVIDETLVDGSEFDLPVEVIGSAEAVETDTFKEIAFTPRMDEPTIRIGLEKTTKPILITADKPYEIRDSVGNPLGIVPAGIVSIVRFDFRFQAYSVETGTISYSGPYYLRFLPREPETIFEIKSMTRNPYFSNSINDNKYRGSLEIRLSEVDNLWVINELKLEEYLRGLAEARDSAPLEFQKAQAVAARSFAYYNVANGGKYKKGYFDLTWTPSDQVYRGYNSELRMRNLVSGVIETRGIFVTYDNKVVTTPYFAQSNGRTKRWSDVWGGRDKPWLQPVSASADEGKRQRGHGVGMSQIDAIWRADQGAKYDEILKHYYTGVEIKKLY